jgi:hypothetical protein
MRHAERLREAFGPLLIRSSEAARTIAVVDLEAHVALAKRGEVARDGGRKATGCL